jgi:hypothetical protein
VWVSRSQDCNPIFTLASIRSADGPPVPGTVPGRVWCGRPVPQRRDRLALFLRGCRPGIDVRGHLGHQRLIARIAAVRGLSPGRGCAIAASRARRALAVVPCGWWVWWGPRRSPGYLV